MLVFGGCGPTFDQLPGLLVFDFAQASLGLETYPQQDPRDDRFTKLLRLLQGVMGSLYLSHIRFHEGPFITLSGRYGGYHY